MSTELPNLTRVLRTHARVTIVVSGYNEKYTSALLKNCKEELEEKSHVSINIVRVPGAYEIPVMVKRAILKANEDQEPDTVIALGVILRGSTAHADLIGTAVCNQLLSIACETMTPVINEVLLLDDEQQAFARCIASALNRGREAARAALAVLAELEEQNGLKDSLHRASKVDRNAPLFR